MVGKIKSKNRGDRRPAKGYETKIPVQALLPPLLVDLTWGQAQAIIPRRKRQKAVNGVIADAREAGYKTLGDVCKETGIPMNTLRRWDGERLPPLHRYRGCRVIPKEEYDDYLQQALSSRRQ